jgi:hypothetical protein
MGLVLRRGLPLATSDDQFRAAAQAVDVASFPPWWPRQQEVYIVQGLVTKQIGLSTSSTFLECIL